MQEDYQEREIAQRGIDRAMAPGVRKHFAEVSRELLEYEHGIPPANYHPANSIDVLQQIIDLEF